MSTKYHIQIIIIISSSSTKKILFTTIPTLKGKRLDLLTFHAKRIFNHPFILWSFELLLCNKSLTERLSSHPICRGTRYCEGPLAVYFRCQAEVVQGSLWR